MATIDLQYVGPDRTGRPVYDGDLVVYEDRVWRLDGRWLRDIAGDSVKFLESVGTAYVERLKQR